MESGVAGLPSRLGVLQSARQSKPSGGGGEEVEQPSGGGGEEVEQPAPKAARLAAPRGLLGPPRQAVLQQATAMAAEVKQERTDGTPSAGELSQPGGQQQEQQEQQPAQDQPAEQLPELQGQRERRPPQPRSSRRQQGQQRRQQQQERSSAEEEEEQEQQLPQGQGTRYIGVRRSSREGKPTYTMVLADVPNAQDLLERWQFEFPSAVSRWRLWEECVGLFSRRVSYIKGRRLDSARRQAGWQAALPDRVLRHRAAVMQTSAVGCSFKLAWQVAFQGAPH